MQNVLNTLHSIQLNDYSFKMHYITKIKKKSIPLNYLSFSVPIHDTIHKDIGDSILHSLIQQLTNTELIEFDTTLTHTGTVEFLPKEDVNNLDSMLSAVNQITTEGLSELDFNQIWSYTLTITSSLFPTSPLVLFKKFSYPKIMQKSIFLSLINGAYDKYDNQLITIDNTCDSFLYQDNMYILNKHKFENLFNFSSAYQQQISASIDTLTSLNLMDNLNEFVDSCLNSDTLTRRFVKILQEERFEAAVKYATNIPVVIDKFDLDINFDSNTNKIMYDSSTNVSDILTLIRDACVIGALDDKPYIASGTKNLPTVKKE